MNRLTDRITEWYARFERPISSGSLIAGFLFDALTLKRVDEFWENLWTVGHLVIVAACILLLHIENRRSNPATREREQFWFGLALQFFFGGLLSTFLVFYFRSASVTVSWPFFLILGAAFVANERLEKRSERLTFQVALFFLCLFSFAIFIVPVIIHSIGVWPFLLSGFISLGLIWLFITALGRMSARKFSRSKRSVWAAVASIYLVLNLFYFTNIIPPIPLSLADGGVYHSVVRTASGNYEVTKESSGWLGYLSVFDSFHLAPGAAVYAYSSVFSPASINTNIVHVWEHYDPEKNRWIEMGRVNLELYGGREEGYRTYSAEANLIAGKWRVSVETESGQVVGRIRFTIIPVTALPPLTAEVK